MILNLTTLAGCWHFDNGATSKNDDALTEHDVLLCVLPLAVHLTFFYGQVGGTILKLSHLFVASMIFMMTLRWVGLGWGRA